MKMSRLTRFLVPLTALCCAGNLCGGENLGLFENQVEVGKPGKAGSVAFDPATQVYLVAGGGANMWATNDDFHFVWKRLSGDFSLAADIEMLGAGGNAHRKACLVVRQSLSPDSAYVDVAAHGNGLVALQWREQAGGLTHGTQAKLTGPARVGLERRGEDFFMTVASKGGRLENSEASTRVKLADPVYVGLAVCAHSDKALEKARFSRVELAPK
jgi:hypothetical protein